MDVSSSLSSSPSSVNRFLTSSPVGHENASPRWPKCTKTYNSRWETDPLLKTWIARHPEDKGKVVCRFCQSVIRAHKNDLLEHTRTLKHQRNFMAHATPEEYNQFVMELNELRRDAQLVTKKKVVVKNEGSNNWTGKIANNEYVALNLVPANDCRDDDGKRESGLVTKKKVVLQQNEVTNRAGKISFIDVDTSLIPVVQDCRYSDGGLTFVGSKMWPSPDDDSYMSADSPSDLVSVILEEQAPGSPQGSHNSNESVASAPPTLSPHSSSPLQTHSKADSKTHSGSFTCQQIVNAIQNNYFTLNELVTLAKSALGQIEESVGGSHQSQILNNASPPGYSSLSTPKHKSAAKSKGRRKKSEGGGEAGEIDSSSASAGVGGGASVFRLEPL